MIQGLKTFLRKVLGRPKSERETEDIDVAGGKPAEPEPAWCVVANIVHERGYGPGGEEKRRGTKHFPPGAKVYILHFFWGMGAKRVTVVGRHRGSHRYVILVIDSKILANWRAELVYSPYIVRQIREYKEYNRFGPGAEAAKRRAEDIVTNWSAKTQPFVTRPSGSAGE